MRAKRESVNAAQNIFFSDVSPCVLSCRFMIREHSADPCMISRFEHKSLLCERKCVFVPCAKPAVYNDLQRRYGLHVSILGS